MDAADPARLVAGPGSAAGRLIAGAGFRFAPVDPVRLVAAAVSSTEAVMGGELLGGSRAGASWGLRSLPPWRRRDRQEPVGAALRSGGGQESVGSVLARQRHRTRKRRGDGRVTRDKNGSRAAPSLKFWRTEPTRILQVYSLRSRSAPAAPHPNSRGSGSAPLRSRRSPTKHTVIVSWIVLVGQRCISS
jgi:hypothetical protein